MRKSAQWKLESLGCMVQEPQRGREGQEMGICPLELFRFSYACMHVHTVFNILLAEEGETWIFPQWGRTNVSTH